MTFAEFEKLVIRLNDPAWLTDCLKILSKREVDVLRLRYGLFGDGKMRTREYIGSIFNVTRERIYQIERRAVKRMAKVLWEEMQKDRKAK
jgi:DNA-directed RNA polymerase sigma subunit (sigma70/sigma32)